MIDLFAPDLVQCRILGNLEFTQLLSSLLTPPGRGGFRLELYTVKALNLGVLQDSFRVRV